ncbi:hypothetical protein DNTS_007837, partial [Danionella cerebrum]
PGYTKPLIKEVAFMIMLRRPPVSPYVIEMYEWFDHPANFFLVLEHPQPCLNLRDCVNNFGKPSEHTTRILMRQLMVGVKHCLERGIFHTDLHLKNILVNTNNLDLKIIDFGIALLVDDEGYAYSQHRGAFMCCPPEVYRHQKFYAVPTSCWALGVVLFYLVNGDLPFCSKRATLNCNPAACQSTVST